MYPPQDQRALRCLLARFCEGRASQEEQAWLDAQIVDNPGVRRVYLELMTAEAGIANLVRAKRTNTTTVANLHLVFSEATDAPPANEPQAASPPPEAGWSSWAAGAIDWHVHPLRFYTVSAVLTSLFASLLIALVYSAHDGNSPVASGSSGPSRDTAIVAQVTGNYGAKEQKESAPTFLGANLQPGQTIRLASGQAKIQFKSGAVVDLHGPAELRLDEPNAGHLHHGRLVAFVPPEASGFKIASPLCTVIDRGTRFGLNVLAHAADVSVFQGAVDLIRAEGSDAAILRRLTIGQSVRIESGGPQHAVVVRDEAPAPGTFAFAERLPGEVVRYQFENSGQDALGPSFADGRVGSGVRFVKGRFGLAAAFGKATNLPGQSSIVVPRDKAFRPGGGDFSITFWVKRLQHDTGNTDGVLDSLADRRCGYQVLIRATGVVACRLDDDSKHYVLVRSTTPIIDTDSFHHVAVTVDRGQAVARLYIDGVMQPPVDISMLTGSISPSQDLWIGAHNQHGLDGILDDLRMFRRTLTAEEVATLAAADLENDSTNDSR